ncbi:MAG: hypothetical protein ABR555_13270 [Pyrinomonadaceae bacterium]
MVHALREARQVLKKNATLLDLRPAPVHRNVGIVENGSYNALGKMREWFKDDYVATRAVVQVIESGLFKLERRIRFQCTRKMDRISEFEEWLDDFVGRGKGPSHDWLVHRVDRSLASRSRKAKIIVRAPVDLRILTKI